MTTIACDGVTMTADGFVTEGNVITQGDYPKIRRLNDGRIVGFSGNCYNDDAFAEWLEDSCAGEVPKGLVDEDFACVVLSPTGDLTTYDAFGRSFRESPPYAVGSGRNFALAAMDLGKSPQEAVIYACTRDAYSGGVVMSLDREVVENIIRKAA